MKMYNLLPEMCNPQYFKIEYCEDCNKEWCKRTCKYYLIKNKLERKLKLVGEKLI